MIMDNLGAQCSADSVQCCERELNSRVALGAGGTEYWQGVDHGIGHMYQTLIGGYHDEWMQKCEAIDLLSAQTAPSARRVRELLVEWTHRAYNELEHRRVEAEAAGKHPMNMLALLRTGNLAGWRGLDKEISPEGMEDAIATSTDPYFKAHGITKFHQLLVCMPGRPCEHADNKRPEPAGVVGPQQKADTDFVRARFAELCRSEHPVLKLVVKLLGWGLRWGGSSLVVFITKGVDELNKFLLERGDDGKPRHDLDLYRMRSKTKKMGKGLMRALGWGLEAVTARAVDKMTLTLKRDPTVQFAIDQVNFFRAKMSPSTDLWGNTTAAQMDDGSYGVVKLVAHAGPPLAATLRNLRRLGRGSQVDCFVLRKEVMPFYDENGEFVTRPQNCDGRFSEKLHNRSSIEKLVNLVPYFHPGPLVPHRATFLGSPDRDLVHGGGGGSVEGPSISTDEEPTTGRVRYQARVEWKRAVDRRKRAVG